MPLSRDAKARLVALAVALVVAILRCLDAVQTGESLLSMILSPLVLFVTVGPGIYSLRNVWPGRRAPTVALLDEYGWSFGRATTLGVLGLVTAQIAGSVYGAVLSLGTFGMFDDPSLESRIADEDLKALIMGISAQASGLFALGATYFVGRAVGRNCKEKGVYAVLWIPLVFVALNFAINTSYLGLREYLDLLSSMDASILYALVMLLAMAAVGLLGYWRGRARRLSAYVHSVVAALPAEVCSRLLDAARAEVVNAQEAEVETLPNEV